LVTTKIHNTSFLLYLMRYIYPFNGRTFKSRFFRGKMGAIGLEKT